VKLGVGGSSSADTVSVARVYLRGHGEVCHLLSDSTDFGMHLFCVRFLRSSSEVDPNCGGTS